MDSKIKYINNIKKDCESIFSGLAAHPENVDDSLIPLISSMEEIESRYRTTIYGNERDLNHLKENIKNFRDDLSPSSECFSNFSGREDAFKTLKRIEETLNNAEKLNPDNCFLELIVLIKSLWNCGGDLDGIAIKGSPHTHKILMDICKLARWNIDFS